MKRNIKKLQASEKMKQSKHNSFVKIGLVYTISNFVIKGMAFLTTPIFTRLMSQEEYGQFSNIASWANIIMIITTLCLYSSISRAKYDYNNNIMGYISTITILGSIVTLLIWAIIEWRIEFFEEMFQMNRVYIRCIMLNCLFTPAVQSLITKYRMYNEYKLVIIMTWITLLITTISSLVLTCFMRNRLTGRVVGNYAIIAVVDIIFWLYIVVKGKTFSIDMCRYACSLAIPLLIHELSGVLLNSSDRIIINQLCGSTDAALYSIAYTIAMIITVLLSSLNNAWIPWFFDKLEENRYGEIKKYATGYTFFFTIGCIGLMMIGPELVMIFGGKNYMDAIYVIPPVCMAIEFQFVYTLYVNIEFFLKKTLYISIATAGATIINIALNYWLIPIFGYGAAAYTTIIGYLFMLVFHYIICSKTQYKKVFDERKLFLSIAITAIGMFAALILYQNQVIRWLSILVIVIVLLTIVYLKRKMISEILKK